MAAPSAATWPSTIRATVRPLRHVGVTLMDMAVHAALLISVVVVATGVEVTGEAAMMTGMAMAAGAVAAAGGPLQHYFPSVHCRSTLAFAVFSLSCMASPLFVRHPKLLTLRQVQGLLLHCAFVIDPATTGWLWSWLSLCRWNATWHRSPGSSRALCIFRSYACPQVHKTQVGTSRHLQAGADSILSGSGGHW